MTRHTITITTNDPDSYLPVVVSQVAEGYTSGHHDRGNHWKMDTADPDADECPKCQTDKYTETTTAHAIAILHYRCVNCDTRWKI